MTERLAGRISIIGPTHPFRGGISHYTTLLALTLRRCHKVQFLSFTQQYPAFLYPGKTDRDPSDEPIRDPEALHVLNPLNPRSWRVAVHELDEFSPELVILPWWVAYWAPCFSYLLRGARKRTSAWITIICHNVIEHESNPLKVWATRSVLSRADRLITHSDEETRRLVRLLGDSIETTTAFHPTYAELNRSHWSRANARERLALSGNVLLFFGFVRPYKGLGALLEALALVLKHQPVMLLVVGEFWKDKQEYVHQIERLGLDGRVRLIDTYVPNEDLGLYFAAADLVVQPYRSATGSGVCQLAYGFDRPVIATNVGSLSEVVNDGVNGRIVEPGDPVALAQAIVDALEPETLRAMTEAAARTKERFSWERLAEIITRDLPEPGNTAGAG